MRLNISTPTLFAVSSLFCFGSSLPFLSRRSPVLEPLVRRATYSVVPVDGGPAATKDGSPEATIVKTIIHTPAPVTIVETDNVTLPPVTDVVVSTKIIEGPKSTQTVLVTVTHSPVAPTATTTATKYSIIDVSSPPVTVVIPAPAASRSSSSAAPRSSSSTSIATTSTSVAVPSQSASSSAVATPSSSSKASTTTSESTYTPSAALSLPTTTSDSSLPTSTSTPIASTSSSSAAVTLSTSSAQITSIETSSTFSSSAVESTSTPTYDNGQWHTYYPPWSNTTGTPTGLASVPTLKARLDSAPEGAANHGIVAALKQIVS
ncbi:hypothetical protein IFR04_008298 [Cadophora malorum]|uniref:Uncharacterized protein n=1 Tax=Cadophora malorum TaxID=108018 RepID=A0A8H7W7V8_9HELO|nr:hypothetical protein IFR04_008298 [Cadophora malorum]